MRGLAGKEAWKYKGTDALCQAEDAVLPTQWRGDARQEVALCQKTGFLQLIKGHWGLARLTGMFIYLFL